MAQDILITQNLSIGYESKKERLCLAQNLNLSLGAGKLIALIGANGVGKSSLLRSITGIQKPLEGTVLLNGKNINHYQPLELAQNLSVVLTEKLPPSNLSVFELVALGRQPYTNWLGTLTERDIQIIENAIELTQIASLSDKKHYEISDGQLQKVLIARALAQDTPLIVLDEPSTHLDLLHKVSLLKLLKRLSSQTGKCILFSTHDIEMAIQLSDQMIVMSPDSLVQGQPCELIGRGVFNKLFPDDHITFDSDKGTFIIS